MGWQGPFRVATSELGQEPPGFLECGGADAAQAYVGEVTAPSPCTPCACGAMSGASCSGGGMAYSLGGASCLDVNQSLPAQDWKGACFPFDAPSNGQLVVAPLATNPVAGSCPASGGAFQPGNYAGDVHRLCPGAPSAGESRCILGPANAVCPAGWEATKKAVAKNFVDGRSCGPCTCETQTFPTCEGDRFNLMFTGDCLDFGPFPKFGPTCGAASFAPPTPGTKWSLERLPATPTGGSCSPKGGAVQGSITQESPATLCCQ